MRTTTGIALIAMRGPDVPIPIIPRPNRKRSGRCGIFVWFSMEDTEQRYLKNALMV
jgi:hypothetical protein